MDKVNEIVKEEDWDNSLLRASQLLEGRENYQKTLGRLCSSIAKHYGPSSLKDFASAIKETYGVEISPATLRNYRWVWDSVSGLDLPEDLSYRSLQFIASSGRPEFWAKMIKDKGLSSVEIYKLIRKDKGLDKVEIKKVVCDNCGATVYVK